MLCMRMQCIVRLFIHYGGMIRRMQWYVQVGFDLIVTHAHR